MNLKFSTLGEVPGELYIVANAIFLLSDSNDIARNSSSNSDVSNWLNVMSFCIRIATPATLLPHGLDFLYLSLLHDS